MSREAMRRTGYEVVDLMLDWIDQPDPVIMRATSQDMASLLHRPSQEEPRGVDEVIRTLVDDVLPYASKIGHPGYFAYIPGGTTWPAALAEFMATVANVYVGTWMEAAAVSQLELTVLDWFRDWLGMPTGTEGVLVSGGSAANLTAMVTAREQRIGAMASDAVIYCADQAHSSVGRSARVLGFGPDQVRIVPSDGHYRMRVDALRTAIEIDVAAGRRPLLVSAAAGATNTGAVDPLDELADLCAQLDVWLHVDGAYGGFAVLSERGRVALRGIERADSVTLDPHKWLQQPMECAALLVRKPGALEHAFSVVPDYLADTHSHDGVDFSDRGLQLTRGARAMKVWASLSTFGVGAFREVVDRNLDLAQLAQRIVEGNPDLELMNPATLGIMCFRRSIPGHTEAQTASVNSWLVRELEATGRAMVSTTRLHGRFAVRMVVLSHLSDESDVRFTLDFFARTEVPPAVYAVENPVGVLVDTALPGLLTDAGRRSIDQASFRRGFRAGDTIVARWGTDRDFYIVLSGEVSVLVEGVFVRSLATGAFFGEIAATDWGSGYGYVRTADVIAATDAEVLLVPVETLTQLLASEPALREAVQRARGERLSQM
jgi:glutamate/tyrosine decarboxylase-like PLP-dependent enzyme